MNTENTVFLMIDIQEKLVYMLKNSAEIAKNNFVLANAASILNVPVILTEQYPQGLGSTISQVKSFVDTNNVFEKTSFSAFDVEDVKSALEKTGRKKVVLTGIETHICVYQTARALLNAGYEVYVELKHEYVFSSLSARGGHVLEYWQMKMKYICLW